LWIVEGLAHSRFRRKWRFNPYSSLHRLLVLGVLASLTFHAGALLCSGRPRFRIFPRFFCVTASRLSARPRQNNSKAKFARLAMAHCNLQIDLKEHQLIPRLMYNVFELGGGGTPPRDCRPWKRTRRREKCTSVTQLQSSVLTMPLKAPPSIDPSTPTCFVRSRIVPYSVNVGFA
jgi:hypothetical protein